MRILSISIALALALVVAASDAAQARNIRPHFDKPWRERVADAQAAHLLSPRLPPAPTAIPPTAVRSANESWEVDGLILAWECGSPAASPDAWDDLWLAIIDAAWDHADLYIYLIDGGGSDASDLARCQEMLTTHTGRNPADAVWFTEDDDKNLDSIWIRDYGPLFVFDPAKTAAIVDADYVRYNRIRDDAQPGHFATYMAMTRHEWDFATEGGNFLANGNGICLVSSTIYGLNPGYDTAAIEQQYLDYLGCTDLVILPAVEDVTGHVDMWMFWLDHKTLIVAEYTNAQNASARAEMETAVSDQLTGLVDPKTGDDIEIVRIPMPDDSGGVWRTYTNGIWIDDNFLMPVYAGNATAQATVTTTLENRGVTVIPINSDVIISSAGALHCISKTIPSPAGLPPDGPDDPDAGATASDAGATDSDAGASRDGGLPGADAGIGDDGGEAGCCGVGGSGGSSWLLTLCVLFALPRRRRR